MVRILVVCFCCAVLAACATEPTAPPRARVVTIEEPGRPIIKDASDQQIRRALIASSIESYLLTQGNCPCPYLRDAADRHCGKMSAYCKPQGEQPLCFDEDITQEMLQRYRNWQPGMKRITRVPPKKDACT